MNANYALYILGAVNIALIIGLVIVNVMAWKQIKGILLLLQSRSPEEYLYYQDPKILKEHIEDAKDRLKLA